MKDSAFVRQPSNIGAVINTDIEGLKAYKLQKQRAKAFDAVVEDLENVKKDVTEIRDMLKILIDRYPQ